MYRVLIFIKKGPERESVEEIIKSAFPLISQLNTVQPDLYSVDSSLLMETSYSHMFEIGFPSKDSFNLQMSTPEGKVLQSYLMGLQQSIDILFVKKEQDEFISNKTR